ncbi:MAG: DUF4423 domain-containing protein [Proteobacteria bacterium]|nr:MAG: DUF4423 domain-containing protein [Pseudomonadota bacterium]
MFSYNNYKSYLIERIEQDSEARGLKKKIAEAIQCQASYLSQVLHGNPDLTLDQANRLNNFFHHTVRESRYFLLLLQVSRAGTADLKALFEAEVSEKQKENFDLKTRLVETDDIPDSVQHRYYSTWFYSAIHVALSIRGMRPESIAVLYNLPLFLVNEVIEFLEASGLIRSTDDGYEFTKRRFHLQRDSEFVQRHHINWRSQALQSAEKNYATDLHYSNVIAISEVDFIKIKDLLVQSVQNAWKLVGPSNEETVCAFTLDFFRL